MTLSSKHNLSCICNGGVEKKGSIILIWVISSLADIQTPPWNYSIWTLTQPSLSISAKEEQRPSRCVINWCLSSGLVRCEVASWEICSILQDGYPLYLSFVPHTFCWIVFHNCCGTDFMSCSFGNFSFSWFEDHCNEINPKVNTPGWMGERRCISALKSYSSLQRRTDARNWRKDRKYVVKSGSINHRANPKQSRSMSWEVLKPKIIP